jgi:hypothetical protein
MKMIVATLIMITIVFTHREPVSPATDVPLTGH